MIDNEISIEAKAIYAYLCSYSGEKMEAYPSISLMSSQLKISKGRLGKHIKFLLEKNYISIKHIRTGGHYGNNLYIINQNISIDNYDGVSILSLQKKILKVNYKEFLQSEYWMYVTNVVKKRDNYSCIICGSKTKLEVHHKTYENARNEHNHIEDLVTLCHFCHSNEHCKNNYTRTKR